MASRRLRGWQPPLENINSLVASGGPRLLARARELVVTNGYAGNACEAFAANLVGDGIKPSSLIEDAEVRDRVQRLWLAWTDEADADGLTDFYGLQAMVAREMFVAGECFVRLRPRRAEDGLPVPLQLQVLEGVQTVSRDEQQHAEPALEVAPDRVECGIGRARSITSWRICPRESSAVTTLPAAPPRREPGRGRMLLSGRCAAANSSFVASTKHGVLILEMSTGVPFSER